MRIGQPIHQGLPMSDTTSTDSASERRSRPKKTDRPSIPLPNGDSGEPVPKLGAELGMSERCVSHLAARAQYPRRTAQRVQLRLPKYRVGGVSRVDYRRGAEAAAEAVMTGLEENGFGKNSHYRHATVRRFIGARAEVTP
jgi:hypothetical protein